MTDQFTARPTLYRGIPMRSRLEADFARWLDQHFGLPWQYEPHCFASERGQYLPDFQIDRDTRPYVGWYIEVKPTGLTVAQVDQMLDRMTIIRASEPTAMLELVLWRYQADEAPLTVMAHGNPYPDDRVVFVNGELHPLWFWHAVKATARG